MDSFLDVEQAEGRLAQGTMSPVDQRFIATGCFTMLAGAIDEVSDAHTTNLVHDDDCAFRQAPLFDLGDPASDPELDAVRWTRHAYAHHVPFYSEREPFEPAEPGEKKSYGPEHMAAVFAMLAGGDSDTVAEHDRADRSDMPCEHKMETKAGEPTQTFVFLKFTPWLARLARWRDAPEGRREAVVAVLEPLLDQHVYVAIRHFRELIAQRITDTQGGLEEEE